MTDNIQRIEYKGYRIWTNTKSVVHKNKLSGHSWTEQVPLKNFYVSGKGASVTQLFRSIPTCKEHIDFLIKFQIGLT